MTDEQRKWLDENKEFEPVGPPRPGVSFTDVGTLYADGEYDLSLHLKPIRLEPGCFAVGKRVD